MVELTPYNEIYRNEALNRMVDFFGFHLSLSNEKPDDRNNSSKITHETIMTLHEWLNPPSTLYIILSDSISVGFIRINYRGGNVAYIEDIYVDPDMRGRKIASKAIEETENIIKNTPGYTAVSLEVLPRNKAALYLYHKLGYNTLSILTLRKELYKEKPKGMLDIFDLDFNY
jgi:ribosomal protein S18 acetylase RimI-like enzyme